MKFIAKEQPLIELGLGDVVEYTVNNSVVRLMIVRGFDDEGLWGYKLFNFEKNEVLESMYDEFDDIFYEYKKFKGFRIIKSENLELREV